MLLTTEQIATKAPAVFAETPSSHLSNRYGFVPTREIVASLAQTGWGVASARQVGRRNASVFSKHKLTFRRDNAPVILNEVSPSVDLFNSHDGTSGFLVSLGLTRLVCTNGLSVPAFAGASFSYRVRHSIKAVEGIQEAIAKIMDNLPLLENGIQNWMETPCGMDGAIRLAETGLTARYGEDRTKWPTQPSRVVDIVRREEDRGDSLWVVLNRVQENVIRGDYGSPVRVANAVTPKNRMRRMGSVRSIVADHRINSALWRTADELALAS